MAFLIRFCKEKMNYYSFVKNKLDALNKNSNRRYNNKRLGKSEWI